MLWWRAHWPWWGGMMKCQPGATLPFFLPCDEVPVLECFTYTSSLLPSLLTGKHRVASSFLVHLLHPELNIPHGTQPAWTGRWDLLPPPILAPDLGLLAVVSPRSDSLSEFTFNVMNKTNFSMQRKLMVFPPTGRGKVHYRV